MRLSRELSDGVMVVCLTQYSLFLWSFYLCKDKCGAAVYYVMVTLSMKLLLTNSCLFIFT